MANLAVRRVYGANLKDLDVPHVQAYTGLLILAGVYKSKGEARVSLWHADTGVERFPGTRSLKTFHVFSRVIRFDDRETRQGETNSQLYIWDVWDPFFTIQAPMYVCLVAFHALPLPGKIKMKEKEGKSDDFCKKLFCF